MPVCFAGPFMTLRLSIAVSLRCSFLRCKHARVESGLVICGNLNGAAMPVSYILFWPALKWVARGVQTGRHMVFVRSLG